MSPTRSRLLSFALGAALALPALAPAPARAQDDDEEVKKLEEQAEEVAKLVEKIRGIKFSGPVKKGIQSKDELREFVMEELAKEMPDEKVRGLEKAYVKFGFLKPGTDLKKILIDLYSEQIAGFYNPEKKELFLILHGGPEQPMLMAHELTHALQDQNFDLLPLQKSIVDNDDRSLALTSVVEGDATIVMVTYLLQSQGLPLDIDSLPDVGQMMKMQMQFGQMLGGGEGMQVLKTAPKILTENLMFGYVDGAGFCQKAVKKDRAGWKGVTRLFEELPQSSEQILHPDKYFGKDRDEPIEVELPDLAKELGEGWKLLAKNVMGEFNTALLFREKLPAGEAAKAAAGWGGDAWQALEGPKGEVVIFWCSVWDTEDDAKEFAETYKDFARERVAQSGYRKFVVDGKRVVIFDGDTQEGFLATSRLLANVKTRTGYSSGLKGTTGAPTAAAASGSPFANLKLPEGWDEAKPDDQAVKQLARCPDGAEFRLLESPAAARSSAGAAKQAAEAIDEPLKGESKVKTLKLGDRDAASLTYTTEDGVRHMQLYVVEGETQHTAALRGKPKAVEAAYKALRAANPSLAGPPAGKGKKKEPTLF